MADGIGDDSNEAAFISVAVLRGRMNVTVYGELRAATGSKTVELDVAPETVADALTAFTDAYPRARSAILDDTGDVRPSVRVMVDGERADLGEDCPSDATVQLFPAMQGGAKDES